MRLYLILLIFLLLEACTPSSLELNDYLAYISNPKNGLVQSRKINALAFKVKYLPIDYLVYQIVGDKPYTLESIDKERSNYKGSFNLLMQISPNEEEVSFDVMTETVASIQEFKQHSFTMNFELKDYMELHIGEQKLKPILVELENTYGLTKHRNVNIVFALDGLEIDSYSTIDFVFRDEVFKTGIHHFVFDRNNIDHIPALKF